MRRLTGRLLRGGLAVGVLWLLCLALLPAVMQRYPAFAINRGVGAGCFTRPGGFQPGVDPCVKSIADLYDAPLGQVVIEAAGRSLVLLVGVAAFALTIGLLLGLGAALLRYRPVSHGVILGSTSIFAAIPSFFMAFFLQIVIIIAGGVAGHTVLPVFGFGLDGHLVLPLLTLGLPAVAIAAQVSAARTAEVLDADFVTTARAKGLLTTQILLVHVLPHVVPVLLEAVGSGLRVAVASLPIVEFILGWNGIGFLTLQAVAVRDAPALTACFVTLAGMFAATTVVVEARSR